MEYFKKNTVDPNKFIINDVIGDNACFYRSLGLYIYFATPYKEMNKVKRFYKWGQYKNVEQVNADLPKSSTNLEELARFLQTKIVDYIENNENEIITETGMTIKQTIEVVHNISFEEYLSYYDVFAGDIDLEMLDEEIYFERWGSIVEQYVISKIIKCPIIVYNTQKWDTRYNKIVNGKVIKNKPEKGVRLKVTSILGKEYINKKIPICLIWREYNKNGHYLVCYPKNPSNNLDDYIY